MDSKVIDSRLTNDGISIRRRRQCLDCSERFTTYEAIESGMLSILIRKKVGRGATVKNFRTLLDFMSSTIKTLSDETEILIGKMDKLEEAQAAKAGKVVGRGAPRKRVMKKAAARGPQVTTASEVVLRIIKRHKKGVDISKLKDKTGFDDKKIRNIIHREFKQGKIKRYSRGVYISA